MLITEARIVVFFNLWEMCKCAGTAEPSAAKFWSSVQLPKDTAVPIQPFSLGRAVAQSMGCNVIS